MGLRKDHNSLTVKVHEVDQETQQNKRGIKLLDAEVTSLKDDVKSLYRLTDEFRKEMDELSEKVAELYVLKKIMAVSFLHLVLSEILIRSVYSGAKRFC
jgi:uncharacterized coiled-coil DUF342 family protein